MKRHLSSLRRLREAYKFSGEQILTRDDILSDEGSIIDFDGHLFAPVDGLESQDSDKMQWSCNAYEYNTQKEVTLYFRQVAADPSFDEDDWLLVDYEFV